ncbi:uncharacterized protein LOC143039639 [Oratosquilla oratoria]|uniref:uncharacterized protein LOC143039639 n=1 Tax=Oratosquilla oratoria TaxID=337810 RepID=UPI003F76C1E3
MGDLNGHVGVDRDGYNNVVGGFAIGNRNREGERLLDFCVLNNLAIMNTYFKHKDEHNDVKSIPSLSCDSDHRMVKGKINFIQPKSGKGPVRKRFTTEKLINPEVALQLAQKVEENYTEPETRDIKVEWNKFRDGIKKAYEDVLQPKTTGRRKKKNTPWWNEVKEWVRRKNKAFRIWMKTRRPQDRQEYVSRRNETEIIKRNSKKTAG